MIAASSSLQAGRAFAVLLILGVSGCTIGRRVDVPHVAPVEKPLVFVPRTFSPSFDCLEAASTVQDAICGSKTLAELDNAMAATYRRDLRNTELIDRDRLMATQIRWLIARKSACKLPDARQKDVSPDPAMETCLTRLYRDRLAVLTTWSQPVRTGGAGQPISAYVEFRGLEYRDKALCTPLREVLQNAILRHGDVDPAHLSDVTEIAGTHGEAVAPAGTRPFKLAVTSYEGGPGASFQLRAQALFVGDGATPTVEQTIFTKWIRTQPNSGGRFFIAASDTKDFAALDVVQYDGRLLALVVEPWGYYSPASIGEPSYAGVYEILGPGNAEPRCLFKTFSRPPVHGAFDELPAFTALKALLEQMRGDPPADFDPNDRREAHLLQQDTLWNLLNLPLVGTEEERQRGWAGWLRNRHDATLDALFVWSERDLTSKNLYRRLLDLLRPTSTELVTTFEQVQGLSQSEAQVAADLVMMELIEQTIGAYPGSAAVAAANPAGLLAYRPRFYVAPMPGDLEGGRPIANLHSALLNHAPLPVIADFVKYELTEPGHRHSVGAGGETALMAAVDLPDAVAMLLAAGANPNEADAVHRTALMAAAQADRFESAQRLLDGGANLHAATSAGTEDGPDGTPMSEFQIPAGATALMLAAAHAHPPFIQLFINHGAKFGDRDASGHTACDYLAGNTALQKDERTTLKSLMCK